jgi:uroporphyrinogen-III synthase
MEDKAILYLGTDPTHFKTDGKLIHYPVIRIVPRPLQDSAVQDVFKRIDAFSHVIFTSKNTVRIFFDYVQQLNIRQIRFFCISIGKITTLELLKYGVKPLIEASVETQEGLIEALCKQDWTESKVFYPRSSLARSVLADFFQKHKIAHELCDLYDTVFEKPFPLPDLTRIDEIVFTSPSTVEAFFRIFPSVPSRIRIRALGPVTEQTLKKYGSFFI